MSIIKKIIDKSYLESQQIKDSTSGGYREWDNEVILAGADSMFGPIRYLESFLHVPGVIERLEQEQYVKDCYKLEGIGGVSYYSLLKQINGLASTARTILWAKKMSWIGDWDFNFGGEHTILSISLMDTPPSYPDRAKIGIPMNLHTTGGVDEINYHLDIKSSEAGFDGYASIDSFGEEWNDFNFCLWSKNVGYAQKFESAVFKWERSKFAGIIRNTPLYGERITEFFGKDYIYYDKKDKSTDRN